MNPLDNASLRNGVELGIQYLQKIVVLRMLSKKSGLKYLNNL
jgi:hypothetical protein